jgi:hypothetical protein
MVASTHILVGVALVAAVACVFIVLNKENEAAGGDGLVAVRVTGTLTHSGGSVKAEMYYCEQCYQYGPDGQADYALVGYSSGGKTILTEMELGYTFVYGSDGALENCERADAEHLVKAQELLGSLSGTYDGSTVTFSKDLAFAVASAEGFEELPEDAQSVMGHFVPSVDDCKTVSGGNDDVAVEEDEDGEGERRRLISERTGDDSAELEWSANNRNLKHTWNDVTNDDAKNGGANGYGKVNWVEGWDMWRYRKSNAVLRCFDDNLEVYVVRSRSPKQSTTYPFNIIFGGTNDGNTGSYVDDIWDDIQFGPRTAGKSTKASGQVFHSGFYKHVHSHEDAGRFMSNGVGYGHDAKGGLECVFAYLNGFNQIRTTAVNYGHSPRSSRFPLTQGQGDCDNDSHCAGDLKCFQRHHGEDVPGVAFTVDFPQDYDVCYQSEYRTFADDAKGVSAHTTAGYLQKGEGDCDYDSHCEGSLKCFQRNYNEQIPGLSMRNIPDSRRDWDFCYDPSDTYPLQLVAHVGGFSLGGSAAQVFGAVYGVGQYGLRTFGSAKTKWGVGNGCSLSGTRAFHNFDPVSSNVMGALTLVQHDVNTAYKYYKYSSCPWYTFGLCDGDWAWGSTGCGSSAGTCYFLVDCAYDFVVYHAPGYSKYFNCWKNHGNAKCYKKGEN